jgi:methionyl aminopeptidase
MIKKEYDYLIKAGKIAAEARNLGAKIIKPGVSFLEVAEAVESKIFEKNAKLAFPVNIAVNEKAAHYTPVSDDENIFHKGDIVKLDVGAHVEGFIADTAVTVEVESEKNSNLLAASEEALDEAIKKIKPGVNLNLVGKKIQKTIESYGFKSVDNLTGHSLEKYNLHSGVSVPNVTEHLGGTKVKEDMVLAVEPFATTGKGHVISGEGSNIYRCRKTYRSHIVRDQKYVIVYKKINKKFGNLPFSSRDFQKEFTGFSDKILKKLSFFGMLKHYPQLIEQDRGLVSQKEHTLIVTKEGCEVTTRL